MSFWNEKTIGQLTALWKTGASISAIGKIMGIGRGAVVGKANRLGLPPRVVPESLRSKPARRPEPKPKQAKKKHLNRDNGFPDRRDQCRFPLWPHFATWDHPDYLKFCGKPVGEEGGSWCAAHIRKVYQRKQEADESAQAGAQ